MHTPIDRGFNVAVLHIANKLFPAGFDVSPDAPDTFEALKEHVARTGRMVVSSENSDATIFGDPEVNYAFRAWHDWAHLKGNYPFTLRGEIDAYLMQRDHLVTLYGMVKSRPWRKLMMAEIVGQASYMKRHGRFPTDQVGFDLAYLADHDAALDRADW